MAPTVLTANGVDLSAFAMWVEAPRGWGSAPVRQDRTTRTNGAGVIVSPLAADVQPRQWSAPGILIAQSVADALAQWDAAKAVLADVWLEIVFAPWPDRMCVCRYQSMEWVPARSGDFGFRFTLNFLAPSAYLVAPLVDSYGLSAGGEVALVLGTAPSPFVVRFIGPASHPTLTYRDAHGVTRGALIIAADLDPDEWLEVDSQTMVMVGHDPAGLVANAGPLLDNATQEFALDPADAAGAAMPTLALDSGSAAVYVRRCFL